MRRRSNSCARLWSGLRTATPIPKDAEPIYYLGAMLKAEGRTDEAYTWFYKATWSQAWKAAGYYSLAQIAASRGDMAAALDFVNRSIDSNALNIRAAEPESRSAAPSRPQAGGIAGAGLCLARRGSAGRARHGGDILASGEKDAGQGLAATMNQFPATAQETAAEYMNGGSGRMAPTCCQLSIAAAPEKARINPMVYYYLGYFAQKAGSIARPSRPLRPAGNRCRRTTSFHSRTKPSTCCARQSQANPATRALRITWAISYTTGSRRRLRACGQASVALDPSFAITHRNLAVAYMHQTVGRRHRQSHCRNGEGCLTANTNTPCTSPSSTSFTKRQGCRWRSA